MLRSEGVSEKHFRFSDEFSDIVSEGVYPVRRTQRFSAPTKDGSEKAIVPAMIAATIVANAPARRVRSSMRILVRLQCDWTNYNDESAP